MTATAERLSTVQVDGMTIAYRELGEGPPVLLVHGWPTSSYLWRDVMPAIARSNRVLAIDLPGFGGSSKPVDRGYDFARFESVIDGFLASLGIDSVAVAGHDLGGPVVMHWALARPERVTQIALLNTLVYPEFSEAVMAFIQACTTPEAREQLTSPAGLEAAMRLGVADESKLTAESIAAVQAPFADADARLALAAAGIGLSLEGFAEIARGLPSVKVPMRVVYGAQDKILPDIAETVARIKRDVPQTEVTELPGAGHFLQEEAGAEVGELLAKFFARAG